jgi:hypothetical protein
MLMHKAAFARRNNEGELNGNSLRVWLAHTLNMGYHASP